jgi:hypothetical protein
LLPSIRRTFAKDKSVSGHGVTRQADGHHLRKRHPGFRRFAGSGSTWSFRARRDISIAGSNDLEFSGALSPSLTTIRLRAEQVGIRMAEHILRLIAGLPVAKFHDHPDEPDRSRKSSASGQRPALPLPSDDATSLFNEYSFIYTATACESRMCSHRSHPENFRRNLKDFASSRRETLPFKEPPNDLAGLRQDNDYMDQFDAFQGCSDRPPAAIDVNLCKGAERLIIPCPCHAINA